MSRQTFDSLYRLARRTYADECASGVNRRAAWCRYVQEVEYLRSQVA